MSQAIVRRDLSLMSDVDAPVDAYPLEDLEIAILEVRNILAIKMIASDALKQDVDKTHARLCVLERNVTELRRRRVSERINCKLSDGSKIIDLEVVN